ncbi:MAG: tetratricopeptide repeat protein [Bacteroidota bacterium]
MKAKKRDQQANLIYVLLGLFSVLGLNSLLLYVLDYDIFGAAYRGSLIFHLALGSLLTLPLLAFLSLHLLKMPHRENLKAASLGSFTAFSLFLIFLSGALLYDEDFADQKQLILWVHVLAVIASIFGFFLHLKSKRKKKFHFYIPLSKTTFRRSKYWQKTYKWTVSWAAFLLIIMIFAFRPISLQGPAIAANPIKPAELVIEEEHYLHPAALDGSLSCGQSNCHPDIYQQWNESAHHFSSFNNPYYKKSIEVLLAANGPEKMKWCASCHDPLLLASGSIQGDGLKLINEHPLREKGISCLSCHATQSATDIKGNGNYHLQDPDYLSMSHTFWGESPALRNALIQTKPEPHAASLLKPFLQSEKFCTSCHKVSVPRSVNEYRWKRGQNQYDAWYSSSFSTQNPRTFYTRDRETCISCHMPSVPSHDKGNELGMIKSHRFAAANTALPYINKHPEQLAATQAFLRDDIAQLDIFQIEVNGVVFGPNDSLPPLKGGDAIRVVVLLSNTNTGHNLPAGTNDSNEWWLAMEAERSDGTRLLQSGGLDLDQKVDSTAHFLRAILIDKESNLIDKRNVHEWYATVQNNSVRSGMTQIVRYSFSVPQGENVTRLKISLQQRKFNHFYNEFCFEGEEQAPSIPITEVAKSLRFLDQIYEPALPLWQRWNNYGIGLLGEENYQQALAAFVQVEKIRPDLPDGKLNQARVYLLEGNLPKAQSLLESLRLEYPNNVKVFYFLGETYFALGAYESAQVAWENVLQTYPNDLLLLNNLGELQYLMGQYEVAESYYRRALEIDPEALVAIYGMMLVSGASKQSEASLAWKEQYQFYKKNEAEEDAVAKFKKQNPIINRESQILHYHPLHKVK